MFVGELFGRDADADKLEDLDAAIQAVARGDARTWRFLPDNPITRDGAGGVHTHGTENMQHIRQATRDYDRALRPAGRPGRRQGQAEPTPRARYGLDCTQAHRAYEMHADGHGWREIASDVGVEFVPYEQKSCDRARKRVIRLVEHGKLDKQTGRHN